MNSVRDPQTDEKWLESQKYTATAHSIRLDTRCVSCVVTVHAIVHE